MHKRRNRDEQNGSIDCKEKERMSKDRPCRKSKRSVEKRLNEDRRDTKGEQLYKRRDRGEGLGGEEMI